MACPCGYRQTMPVRQYDINKCGGLGEAFEKIWQVFVLSGKVDANDSAVELVWLINYHLMIISVSKYE